MQQMMTLLVAVIGSSGVASVVVALLNRKWAKEDSGTVTKADLESINRKLDNLTENQKLTCVDRIRFMAKQHIAKGSIDIEDKETIMNLFQSYKKLGGNGHLDIIMKEVEKLSVVDGK